MHNIIWEFRTRNFRVVITAEDEFDVDLSWDETGEVRDDIESGRMEVFCAKCVVYFNGLEVRTDYLGQCIYASPAEFRDHVGINIKSRADGCNYGSYFSDMVREAIGEARKELAELQAVRLRAA